MYLIVLYCPKLLKSKQKERKMLEEQIVTVGPVGKHMGLLVIVLAKRKEDLDGDVVTLFISGREVVSSGVLPHPNEISLIRDKNLVSSVSGQGIGYAWFDIDLSTISSKNDISIVLSNGDTKKSPV